MLGADPKLLYQAANVYALTSPGHPEDRDAALKYLRQSLRDGYREFDTIETDPDMANVRDVPEFGEAIRAARELTK